MTLNFRQFFGPKGFCSWRQSFAYKKFCKALFTWPLSEKFIHILSFEVENISLRPKKVATDLRPDYYVKLSVSSKNKLDTPSLDQMQYFIIIPNKNIHCSVALWFKMSILLKK